MNSITSPDHPDAIEQYTRRTDMLKAWCGAAMMLTILNWLVWPLLFIAVQQFALLLAVVIVLVFQMAAGWTGDQQSLSMRIRSVPFLVPGTLFLIGFVSGIPELLDPSRPYWELSAFGMGLFAFFATLHMVVGAWALMIRTMRLSK
jgi:hypothetical protein